MSGTTARHVADIQWILNLTLPLMAGAALLNSCPSSVDRETLAEIKGLRADLQHHTETCGAESSGPKR